MSDAQRDAYADADAVYSDALGLVDRDNRNHRKKQRLILARTAAQPGDAVLEVGCGHGLHAEGYDARFRYTGVDLSPSLVDATRDRIDDGRALVADARDLPFPDDSFEAVVGTAILHHLDAQERALSEWCRVAAKSVTLMEPNYLFPKDFASAHLVPEERHKREMAPFRLRETVDAVAAEHDATGIVTPHIYTPPWPAALAGLYDVADAAARYVPVLRWVSQMQLIHVSLGDHK